MTDDVSCDDYAVSMQAGDKSPSFESPLQHRLPWQKLLLSHVSCVRVVSNLQSLIIISYQLRPITCALLNNSLKSKYIRLRFVKIFDNVTAVSFVLWQQLYLLFILATNFTQKLCWIVNKVTINVKRIHHRKQIFAAAKQKHHVLVQKSKHIYHSE